MPAGNRKGPQGEGPKTGRGLGYCSDNDRPGFKASQQVQRRGLGFRWGRRGPRWSFGRGRSEHTRFLGAFWRGRDRGAYAIPDAPQDEN